MSTPKICTTPNLAATSLAHQDGLRGGKEHQASWQYNVADHLKSLSQDEIREELKKTQKPFAVHLKIGCKILHFFRV